MEENSVESLEAFEKFKDFFELDIKVKEILYNIAPREEDEFDISSRIKYVDKLYKAFKRIENMIMKIASDIGCDKKEIKTFFNSKIKEFLIGRYSTGITKRLYADVFSNMSEQLVENVKNNFVGFTVNRRHIKEIINESKTINELLHVLHSYAVNNERLLEKLPIIAKRKNSENYDTTLYGEDTPIARNIFDKFPEEAITIIVSMQDQILMMVRDRGHALTIDINTSDKENILVRYFIPKIINENMVKQLPGINKSGITKNGARGMFKTKKLLGDLFNFVELVPRDEDAHRFNYDDLTELADDRKILGINDIAKIFFEGNEVKKEGERINGD